MSGQILFDRYRLLDPVGLGGSAEVWRALDERTGDEVAVKRLHPVVFADEAARSRLRREFRLLRALREPHVVAVRDLCLGEREAALVLDFVDGPSLAAVLREHAGEVPPLPVERSLAIVSDVAAALDAAHAAGIIHRDVTPGNVLLEPDGSARLTDFGIAQGTSEATLTATGLLMGTLRYLAPEQLRGEPASPAVDVHALAAVAYELFAGRPPYAATTPVELVEQQRRGPEPVPGVPPAVDAAIRSGLAERPEDRPSAPGVLAARIRAGMATAAADAPTIAVVVPAGAGMDQVVAAAGSEPSAATSRSRGPAPYAAVAALVLFLAVAAAALAGRQAPAASADAPQPTVSVPARPAASVVAPTPAAGDQDENGNGSGKDKGNGKGHGSGKGDG